MATNKGTMTIQDQIARGNAQKISNASVNYQKVLASSGDKLVINFESILTDYRYFLDKHIQEIDLDENLYMKYRFKPKTLSYDLYGTIEYAGLLLSLNNVVSVSEFDFRKVKIYDNEIKSFLNEVLNKEKTKITKNTSQVNKELT